MAFSGAHNVPILYYFALLKRKYFLLSVQFVVLSKINNNNVTQILHPSKALAICFACEMFFFSFFLAKALTRIISF